MTETMAARRWLLRACLLVPAVAVAISAAAYALRGFNAAVLHVFTEPEYYRNNLGTLWHVLQLQGLDSWAPMLSARQWLAEHPGADVYQAVFFVLQTKFQYPLTSLLYLFWVPEQHPRAWLNLVNLGFVALTCAGGVLLALELAGRMRALRADPVSRTRLAWLVAIGTLCFYPLLRAAELGQIQVVLTALFVWACYADARGLAGTAGLLIGLSTLIKPQMALFLVWGLLRRDRRFVAGWLAPVALGTAASLVLYGPTWPLGYLKVLSFIGAHGETFHANQSVNGLLNRLLGFAGNLEWQAHDFAPYHPLVRGATLVTAVLAVALGLLFGLRDKAGRRSPGPLIVAGICFTMASPVAWEHHYGVLLPAFAFCLVTLLGERRGAHRAAWLLLAATFLLAANALSPLNLLADTPWNFLQSYLFFTALGVLALTCHLDRLARPHLAAAASARPDHAGAPEAGGLAGLLRSPAPGLLKPDGAG